MRPRGRMERGQRLSECYRMADLTRVTVRAEQWGRRLLNCCCGRTPLRHSSQLAGGRPVSTCHDTCKSETTEAQHSQRSVAAASSNQHSAVEPLEGVEVGWLSNGPNATCARLIQLAAAGWFLVHAFILETTHQKPAAFSAC